MGGGRPCFFLWVCFCVFVFAEGQRLLHKSFLFCYAALFLVLRNSRDFFIGPLWHFWVTGGFSSAHVVYDTKGKPRELTVVWVCESLAGLLSLHLVVYCFLCMYNVQCFELHLAGAVGKITNT